MPALYDGPVSSRFSAFHFNGNCRPANLAEAGVSEAMASAVEYAPSGACVGWGIPFEASEAVVINDRPVSIEVERTTARWLVFMHTADMNPPERNKDGFISPMRGNGRLGDALATYVMCFADGREERVPMRGRFQLGPFRRNWGENCFEAVPFQKPYTLQPMNAKQGLP